MGVLIGVIFGLGVVVALSAGRPPRPRSGPDWRERRTELLLQAGIEGVGPGQLLALQAVLGLLAFVVVLAISKAVPVAIAFGIFGGWAPLAIVKRYRRTCTLELREVWPELVDNLASGVRAGLSLPEALSALGTRGPGPLRTPFLRFADDYRATGRFNDCLDRLKAQRADPVGDRVCESLRMAREVGGTDLGRLLRTLSTFLREDARTRAELETRQGWTVNAARLAIGAPWFVLLLLASQSSTITAYNSTSGALVLAIGGGVSVVAYRIMMRIGRLPEEQRVLR